MPEEHKNVEAGRRGRIETQAHSLHHDGLVVVPVIRQRDPHLRSGVAHDVIEPVVVVDQDGRDDVPPTEDEAVAAVQEVEPPAAGEEGEGGVDERVALATRDIEEVEGRLREAS
ncbi:hypothetical protein ZWY2020_001070 [Hordeum vulgare]|nr:hypothetical protein ZWY2020_001070 [Hordeum vulgare]